MKVSNKTDAPWQDEEVLRQKYWAEGKQMSEVADELGCSYSTVLKWMQKHGVERRGKNGSKTDAKYKKESFLKEQYLNQGKSCAQIANECNVSRSTIRDWLKKNGIERRGFDAYEGAEYRDKEKIKRLYHDKGMSLDEVGNELGVSGETVRRWINRFDIDKKTRELPHFFTRKNGYEVIRERVDGETIEVRLHRLLAVAHGELPSDQLRGREKHVHHKNRVRWDNRIENLDVLDASEHMKIHGGEAN